MVLSLLLACPSGTEDSSADTGTASWEPLLWQDCELALDVGSLPELDDQMVFRPAVQGDRAWFSMKGDQRFQSIGEATIDDSGAWTEVDVVLQGIDVDLGEVSSPAIATRPDGGLTLFFDGTHPQEGLSLWRCDLGEGGSWDDCGLIHPQGGAGGLDALGAQIPFALHDGERWRLWYTGEDGGGVRRVLVTSSADGLTWDPPEIAVDLEAEGSWDTTSAYSPFVWRDATGWRLLYAGRALHEDYLVKRLIEARSDDGWAWTDHTGTLDLACEGTVDTWRVDSPWVVPEGDGWRLYYDGFDHPLTDEGTRRILTATAP